MMFYKGRYSNQVWLELNQASAKSQLRNTLVGKVLMRTRPRVRGYTTKEKAKITAGAVTALVITGWLVVLAIAFLSAR
jgi:hypothetical protein